MLLFVPLEAHSALHSYYSYYEGMEKLPLSSSGSFGWLNRQIDKRKSNSICTHGNAPPPCQYMRESGTIHTLEVQRQKGKTKYRLYSELRMR